MKILKLITTLIASVVRYFALHRYKTIRLFLTGFLVVFITFEGCKKDNNNKPKSSQANAPPTLVLLAPGVVKVDSSATLNDALLSVDSVRVTFKDVAVSEKLQVGNILSSGISTLAPMGLLRKVTSITRGGGTIVCNTTMARLSDAVLNTAVTKTFNSDALFRNLPLANPGIATANPLNRNLASLYAGISRSIPFSHNFGSIVVSGEIDISGTLELDLTMSWAKVTAFKADLVTVKSVTVTASNGQSFTGSLSYQLPPINLPPLELDAGVPVTFQAQLLLTVGVTCDLSEKISVTATNTATDDIGEAYQNGTWAPINHETHAFTSQFPKLTAAAKLDPYAKLTLRLIPFGLTDVALSGNVDLTAEASLPLTATLTNNNISINADFDLDFGLDADLTAFDLFHLKFQKDLATTVLSLYSKTYSILPPTQTTPPSTNPSGGNTNPPGNTGGTTTGQLTVKNGITTSFGNVSVNTSPSITLPLINSGPVPITISNVTVNSPFSISPTTTTVPANGSINLTLTFSPTSTGYFNSPIVINSNASNPTVSYVTDGTGTAANSSGNPGGAPSTSGATAVPTIGSYTDCLAVTPNAGCSSFIDGVIHARVVKVDEINHTITFEAENCNRSAFNLPSTLYAYKGLCGGTDLGGVNFPATVYSYQITIPEPDMTGTKSYNIIVQQVNNNKFVVWDAQPISITF